MNHALSKSSSLAALGALSALVLACGTTTTQDSGGTPNNDTAAGYLYVGACTPSVCNALPVSEIGCADGQPEYVCSARPNGECAVDVRCGGSSDDGSVSFSSCEESACGPKPATPADACPSGYEWIGSQCGSLDGGACAWAHACYPPKAAITVDASQVGAACGLDLPCADSAACVTFPRETGVEGAHCVADPCAAISCPSEQCTVLESYPAQVRCL